MPDKKYQMKMSLNVLNHLGLNLYSNVPAVLSEVVANSYDADATEVSIKVEKGKITIEDDGSGMSLDEINERYLYVGYQKRASEIKTPIYKRPVMGRKGIGKLSLFSIANTIELYTIKGGVKNGLKMEKAKIEKEIKNSSVYHPEDISSSTFEITKGTRIVLTGLKKSIDLTESFLKRRLARRFSVIGSAYHFSVSINGNDITLQDRDFFNKIQFLWLFDGTKDAYSATFKNIVKTYKLPSEVDAKNKYVIRGWIGAVQKPSHLKDNDLNNNKISLICRGKLAQEDILEEYSEGGIYADYLIGEIEADFLDSDNQVDIATSSRQKINEDDPRYKSLLAFTYARLKDIQKVWSDLRIEHAKEKVLKENPAIKEWYGRLRSEQQKKQAEKLFSTIETLHFDHDEEGKRRELYKQGILAFERLRVSDNLHKINDLNTATDIQIAAVFSELNEIEAVLYHDIASQRVKVIRELSKITDANAKEKVIQKHIFDNLWLLSPSWERATRGSERLEERVTKAFGTISKFLTPEERKGRFDIKYRTYAGKHIIVELKRYSTSYKLTTEMLAAQVEKYTNALKKCLQTLGRENEPIETLCIIGQPLNGETQDRTNDKLRPYNARVFFYDELIDEALDGYGEYLKREDEMGKLKQILQKI